MSAPHAHLNLSQGTYVLFRVATLTYAFPVAEVQELQRLSLSEVTFIPHRPAAFMGVVNNRGKVIPVVDVRLLLGEASFTAQIDETRAMLQAREQDHVDWLAALRETVRTGAPFTKAKDPTMCAFGKWYEATKADPLALESLTGGNMSLERYFEGFDQPHRTIHALANQVLDLCAKNRKDEAEQMIANAELKELAELKGLFSSFIHHYAQLRQPMMVIVEHGESQVAMAVDAVLSVRDLEPKEGDERGSDLSSEFASSFAIEEDSSLIAITNTASLLGSMEFAA